MKVESESRFLLKFLFHILLTPFILLGVLFGKNRPGDLWRPFRDLKEFFWQPKFTAWMIVINIAVFVVSAFVPMDVLLQLVTYPQDLVTFRWYSFVTAGFLHGGIVHLLGNMMGLFIFGRVVEQKWGAKRTALVYFGALIISSVFTAAIHHFIMQDNVPGLGASGALMGLVAAAILINPFYLSYELIMPLPVMFLGWGALYADIKGVLNPVEDGIGHFAHLGGFLSIAIMAYFMAPEDKKKLRRGLLLNIVSFVALAALVIFLPRN